MQPSYAELHCISNFSFLRGASHPEELVERALALDYTGLAITDECSFAGAARAHLALRTLSGLRPERQEKENEGAGLAPSCSPIQCKDGDGQFRLIHGTEIRLADGPHLVLLAQTRAGYGNLSELVTLARRAAPKGEYRLCAADLAAQAHLLQDSLALLVPSFAPAGVSEGKPGQMPRRQRQSGADLREIERDASWLHRLLPDRSWIACELIRGPDDAAWLDKLQQASLHTGVPLAASRA